MLCLVFKRKWNHLGVEKAAEERLNYTSLCLVAVEVVDRLFLAKGQKELEVTYMRGRCNRASCVLSYEVSSNTVGSTCNFQSIWHNHL